MILYLSPLNISEGGLTKRSQKQTADDLFPIAPPPLFPAPRAHCTFSQASPLFLSLSSSSSVPHHSLFSPPSSTVYGTHPSLFLQHCSPLFPCFPLASCIFSHLSVLSSHSFAPAPHRPSLTLSFHSLPPSPRCATLPVCLPACRYLPIKGCLRPPLC